MNNLNYIPWVEKYRPNDFKNIILNKYNKIILENIINSKFFPNILFYGPPGSGKTTTIINIIKEYKLNNNVSVIHLNASDERGIDIIRFQISTFVNSNSFNNNSIKFVILDEVDYMTKIAQLALKYLIQQYNKNVIFCLICNYISKVEEKLQDEFIKLKFYNLSKKSVNDFLVKINNNEETNFTNKNIINIQNYYNSDIRGMINCIQNNQNINNLFFINDNVYIKIYNLLILKKYTNYKKYINNCINKYNINLKNLIKDFFDYIIRKKKHLLDNNFINKIEYLIHECNNDELLIDYIYYSIFNSE